MSNLSRPVAGENKARRLGLGAEASFTLIELLIVILILGILLAIALPTFLNQQNKAYDADTKDQLSTAYKVSKAEWKSNDDSFPAEGVLVSRLAGSEPQTTFAAGSDFVEDQVSVERLGDDDVWLRSLSKSGRKCRIHMTPGSADDAVRQCEATPGSGDGGQQLAAGLVNRVLNPSFEHPTLFTWFMLNAAPTVNVWEQSSAWASSGNSSLHFSGVGTGSNRYQWVRLGRMGGYRTPVVPGQTYTLSFDLKTVDPIPLATSPKVLGQWYTGNSPSAPPNATQFVLGTVDMSSPGVQRVVINNITVPSASIDYITIDLLSNLSAYSNTLPANESFDYYIDSVLLNETANTFFFDGSSNGTWNGAANNSMSTSTAVNGGGGDWDPF